MKKNYLSFLRLLSVPVIIFGTSNIKAQCPTPTISSTPLSLCQPGGTINLNATAGPGLAINWYTVAVAGTSIGTSTSTGNFNVNAASTTTYYAESVSATSNTVNFNFTGTVQPYVIPAGVTVVTIQTWGAEGGGSSLSGNTSSGLGGKGGYAIGTLTVVPGNTLNVYVGGAGLSSTTGIALGGFNGGGQGHASSAGEPGNGGGGASDVRLNGNAFSDRVIIAGGGGGGGEDSGDPFGHGGGLTGVGYNVTYDASQTAAGAGGSLGIGGGTGQGDGGGGGGGLYGGGTLSSPTIGTDTQGGGGGSGYIGGVQNGTLIAGNAAMTTTSGIGTMTGNSNNGFVRITYSTIVCVSAQRGAYVVTVNPNPTITVNSGGVCPGSSYTMSPSGASTYTFSSGSPVVTPTSNSTYSVTGTSAAGCVSSNAAISTVTLNAIPTVSVNSGVVCAGSTFTMVPTGANTYTFSSGSAVVTPTANSTYSVTGTNSLGCVSSNAAISTVSVNAAPAVTAVSNASLICSGSTVTLTAAGANTYTWNTSATTNTVAVSPSVTTSYTVTGSGANGCTNAITITQSVSACTSINANQLSHSIISVYPNPSNGEFTIATDSDMNLSIVNNLGQVVKEISINSSNNYKASVSNLANGIYFVVGKNNDQLIKTKIVVSK